MPTLSFRNLFLFGLASCAGLLGYALYVQHKLYIDPCPLCIFQRIGFMAAGVWFLLGSIHNPRSLGRKIYGILAGVALVAGGSVSAWHIRLQHLPADQVPDCGPGLNYMLDAFPLRRTLEMVFTGSGECANIDWTFLGLSMPVWTLVWFVGLLVLAIYAGFKAPGKA